MSYSFSKRSLSNLEGVHPDLIRVAMLAIKLSEQDFTITKGVRSLAEQHELYGHSRTAAQLSARGINPAFAKPKSSWKTNAYLASHSTHLIQKDGYGHAIDLAFYPIPTRQADWDSPEGQAKFRAIATAFKQAAKECDVHIEWGGDWKKFDAVHFELSKAKYRA